MARGLLERVYPLDRTVGGIFSRISSYKCPSSSVPKDHHYSMYISCPFCAHPLTAIIYFNMNPPSKSSLNYEAQFMVAYSSFQIGNGASLISPCHQWLVGGVCSSMDLKVFEEWLPWLKSELEILFSPFKRHEGNILHTKNIRIVNSYAVLVDASTIWCRVIASYAPIPHQKKTVISIDSRLQTNGHMNCKKTHIEKWLPEFKHCSWIPGSAPG